MTEILPFYTELFPGRTGSIFNIASSLVKEAQKRKDVKMLIFQPTGKEWPTGPKYWEIEEAGADYIYFENDGATSMPLGYVNNDFRRIQRRVDYTVLLNTRTTASPSFQKICSKPFAGFYPEVINYFNAGDFNEVTMKLHPSTVFECMSSLAMYWNIFHNQPWMNRVTTKMKSVFTPSVVSSFMQKSIAIPLGVSIEDIDAVKSSPEPEAFTLIYGGRPSTHKRVDLMLSAVDYLNNSGSEVKLKLFLLTESSSGATDKIEALRKRPGVEVWTNAPIEEFYAHAKSADAFIAPSTAEAYGISYVEMMYAGAAGIFYNRPWIKGILPEDYKLIVSNMTETVVLLRKLMKAGRKKIKQAIVNPMQEYIRKNHSRRVHVNKVLDASIALALSIKEKRKPTSWGDVWKG